MNSHLKGKKALVTGGGSGIGRAISLALAREGVDVAIASRNPDAETARQIEALGVQAAQLSVDVSDEQQVVAMVQQAIEELDGLDLYVNNAAAGCQQPVTKVTAEAWSNTINTNLSSCVFTCREVARHMIAQGQGSILIVGSTAKWTGSHQESIYRISKTGLHVYMEVLAVELACFGIRANMLTPGHFPTRLTEGITAEHAEILTGEIPLRRFGKTEELGAAAVFLLSDALSSYTTGTELVVDGGLKLRPLPLLSDKAIRQLNL